MAKIINPLAWNVPIVDPKTGRPTPYFKRILEDIADAKISASLIEALGGDPDEDQVVTWDDTAGDLAFKPATDVLDMIDDTHGAILYRDTNDWLALAPGTDGDVLTTHGAAADPTWETPSTGGSGAWTKISTQVLGAAAATIDFSSIASTYEDLVLVVQGRGTNASAVVTVLLRMNGDSGANYNSSRWNRTAANALVAQTSGDIGEIAGASAPASRAHQLIIEIVNYKRTTFHKTATASNGVSSSDVAGGQTPQHAQAVWRNTAAITQLTLLLSAGNFDTGTVATLYGRG